MNLIMEDTILRLVTQVPGFLLAIVVHEAAHAYMACKFGDDTAKNMGRLSLNPMVHLDKIGTIVFPLIGVLIGGIMFGWAKPVPVDPRNFKNFRSAIFWVSFAGPLANIILAIFSAFFLAFIVAYIPSDSFIFSPFIQILKKSVYINIVLAVFNLIPWPPLDGSKMVSSFLERDMLVRYESLAKYSLLFFIFLMYTGVLRYVLTPALIIGEWLIGMFYQFLA